MDSITSHLSHLELGSRRPKTIAARGTLLRAVERYIAPTSMLDADRLALEGFLTRPRAKPFAPETRRAYRSHLVEFYKWALDQELIAVDPTVKIPSVRVPAALPRPVKDEDLAAALQLADPRMKAWLMLMALAGLRACEVARLRPSDVLDGDPPRLFLRETKGGGSDTIPAHPLLVEHLKTLTVVRGMWWNVGPQSVVLGVGDHLKSCGIASTGHALRHYAGTSWYKASGHDLLTTSRLLRHANVQTTQVYAKLDPTRPAEVVGLTTLPPAA